MFLRAGVSNLAGRRVVVRSAAGPCSSRRGGCAPAGRVITGYYMNEAVAFLIRHGYAVLFLWVAVEQLGLPVPSEPVLLATGALAGAGQLWLPLAIVVGVAASLLADVVWYEIGRTRGSRVLRFLCRISLEPDSCVRQSQEQFARYGARALLVAKFVPGLNSVAQPLAGVLGMQRGRFLVFDVLGALLWIGAYMVLGHVFSDQLEQVAAYGAQLGMWAGWSAPGGTGSLRGCQVREAAALHSSIANRAHQRR